MASPVESNVVAVSSPSPQEDPTKQKQQQMSIIHQLLARQLEYYFSTVNLAKDTYVSTLRSLNDGYVPVSIIANFGKVQALAPYDMALEAVQVAATDFSELLEVVQVDSETGKRILPEQQQDQGNNKSNRKTKPIMAVGPISREPIPMELISSNFIGGTAFPAAPATTATPSSLSSTTTPSTTPVNASNSNNSVQNTVILREAPEDAQEESIRDLFNFENCPPIQSVHLDLYNCWFVTLDTSSRDAMVDVMFQLRTKKFPSGEPVKARLKSSAIAASSTSSPPDIVPTLMFVPPPMMANSSSSNSNSSNNSNNANKSKSSSNNNGKKKKRSGNKGRNKGKSQQQQQLQQNSGNDKNNMSNHANLVKRDAAKKTKLEEPPKLGEEDFPALPPAEDDPPLPTNTNKIEVEKVPDQMSKIHGGAGSDSSSTATTSTSSTPSPAQPNTATSVGGYAAALLRSVASPPPAITKKTTVAPASSSVSSSKNGSKTSKDGDTNKLAKKNGNHKAFKNASNDKVSSSSSSTTSSLSENDPIPVTIQPPSWGRGRSFADVLRKENEAAAAAAPRQSV